MMPVNLESQLCLSCLVTGIFQSASVILDIVQNPIKHVVIAVVLFLNNCTMLDCYKNVALLWFLIYASTEPKCVDFN